MFAQKVSTGQWLCPSRLEVCCVKPVAKIFTLAVSKNRTINASSTYKCGKRRLGQWRIVNGQTASIGAWPWQVSIRYGYYRKHHCGGTLVGENWVITAAHCFERSNRPASFSVRLGDHQQGKSDQTEADKLVEKIIPYPYYKNDNSGQHDIALIKLGSKVTYSPHIIPACLPAPTDSFESNHDCWVTGWGDTKGTADDSATLQEVNGMVWSATYCNWVWPGKTGPGTLCFGNGISQPCTGDSGGPMVCQKNGDQFYLAGVVASGTAKCNQAGLPALTTKVTHYIDWIRATMKGM
ncbi:chymotrypsinogen A isoform X2 [Lingula anatina]|nr:chymotrypsinogen A isoform X2 [Lingula anatina]|eukprot:XP_013382949.1 chymotrypsinogen A isoform X2 [Lingula anatina]